MLSRKPSRDCFAYEWVNRSYASDETCGAVVDVRKGCRMDKYSCVTVKDVFYSVPEELVREDGHGQGLPSTRCQ